MFDIIDFYKKTPQEPGHVDIIFEPHFAKKYVHFDVLYFANSELITVYKGGSGWWQDWTYSLDRESAIRYILSDDKKKFRKSVNYYFNDIGINRQHFHDKAISTSYFTEQPFKTFTVRTTCCKSEIKISEGDVCLFVNKVAVINPPFLCPKTGIIWKHSAGQEDFVFSDKFWLFKQIPKPRVFNKFRYLSVNRKEKIDTLYFEDGAYDPELYLAPTKTSFLSGSKFIRKRLGFFCDELTDHRDFLLKQAKTPKFAVIKSAARYLRKRLRISPLRPSEKKFFQMLGALAHINNETTNRKKSYAA